MSGIWGRELFVCDCMAAFKHKTSAARSQNVTKADLWSVLPVHYLSLTILIIHTSHMAVAARPLLSLAQALARFAPCDRLNGLLKYKNKRV